MPFSLDSLLNPDLITCTTFLLLFKSTQMKLSKVIGPIFWCYMKLMQWDIEIDTIEEILVCSRKQQGYLKIHEKIEKRKYSRGWPLFLWSEGYIERESCAQLYSTQYWLLQLILHMWVKARRARASTSFCT